MRTCNDAGSRRVTHLTAFNPNRAPAKRSSSGVSDVVSSILPSSRGGVNIGARSQGRSTGLQHDVASDAGPLRHRQVGRRAGKGHVHRTASARGQLHGPRGEQETVGDQQTGQSDVQPRHLRLLLPCNPLCIDRHRRCHRGVAQQREDRACPGRLHVAGSVGRRGVDHKLGLDDGSGVLRRSECQLQARVLKGLDLGPQGDEPAARLEVAIKHEVKQSHRTRPGTDPCRKVESTVARDRHPGEAEGALRDIVVGLSHMKDAIEVADHRFVGAGGRQHRGQPQVHAGETDLMHPDLADQQGQEFQSGVGGADSDQRCRSIRAEKLDLFD